MNNSDYKYHHRRSIRVKGYDYAQPGWYYITICVYNREHLFGEIRNKEISLNQFGKLAYDLWMQTEQMRDNVFLDEFVIMPDHIHGIIQLTSDDKCKGTKHRAPAKEKFGKPTSNTIPTIIRGYKSIVTKKINEIRCTQGAPVWQRNYYEHIIRNEQELNRIRKYIIENPLKWQNDAYLK